MNNHYTKKGGAMDPVSFGTTAPNGIRGYTNTKRRAVTILKAVRDFTESSSIEILKRIN